MQHLGLFLAGSHKDSPIAVIQDGETRQSQSASLSVATTCRYSGHSRHSDSPCGPSRRVIDEADPRVFLSEDFMPRE